MIDPTLRILMLDDDQAVVYHLRRPGSICDTLEFDEFPSEGEYSIECACPVPSSSPFGLVVDGAIPERLLRLCALGGIRTIDMDIVLLFVSHYATHPIDEAIRRLLSIAVADGSLPMSAIHSAVRLAFDREEVVEVPAKLIVGDEATP
ncbi:hypothetical protein AMJ39_01490 [candidate division TA06 bacterium DG_24]|jgi:hypothetical protein|nr:MAG: hypothetical protein AMJ39_01490 [candidate division TA06 bacterium DG_24]